MAKQKKKNGGLSQVPLEMQASYAFQSLAASGIRVLVLAIFLGYCSDTKKFKFTNATEKKRLRMNQNTFSRAKLDLCEKGFLAWAKRGGLRGCNGVASEFVLTEDWKDWTPTSKQEASHASVTGSSHASVTGLSKSSHVGVTGMGKKQSRQCDTINSIQRGVGE